MALAVYHSYIADAASWVKTVEFWRAVLYCHAMCQRLEPAYIRFHGREKWGNPQLLREAQRAVRSWLISDRLDESAARSLLTEIEPNVPDTEDFADCSDALDAVSVHVYSVEAILAQSREYVAYVYTIAYDRADAAASDAVLPEGGIVTPEVEAAMEQHAHIQEEISWQRQVFALLRAGPPRDEKSIDRWLSTLPRLPQYGPYL